VRWLFPGKEIQIDSRCLDSGDPIRVRMRDGGILEISPSTAVGHANVPLPKWAEHSWAFN
jgi:hypothetical protein